MSNRPALAEQRAELLVERGRQGNLLACPVHGDRLPDRIDDHLAGMAVFQVFLDGPAQGRLALAVDIVTEGCQEFFAVHGFSLGKWRFRPAKVRAPCSGGVLNGPAWS
jgi:hypothetical protein